MISPGDIRLLVVEDNPNDRQLLEIYLGEEGYEIEFAENGRQAWELMFEEKREFDVILLDRMLPEMNGMQLLAKLKEHEELKMLPVILQTAAVDRADIVEGIRAGAYYYLTKPYDRDMLLSIVRSAAEDHGRYAELQVRLKKGETSLALLQEATFACRTIDDARALAAVLARTCPDPSVAVLGLTELLVNAVEHGNLGITYNEKSRLNAAGKWEEEVARRLALPENQGKSVSIRFVREQECVRFFIQDEGSGFEWRRYLEIDPQRAFDTHGRGIAIANLLSFHEIQYLGCGNEVQAVVKLDGAAERRMATG